MSAILQDDQIDSWLDPTTSDPHVLGELLKAPREDFLDCYPVSRQINSARFDNPHYADKADFDYQGLLQERKG